MKNTQFSNNTKNPEEQGNKNSIITSIFNFLGDKWVTFSLSILSLLFVSWLAATELLQPSLLIDHSIETIPTGLHLPSDLLEERINVAPVYSESKEALLWLSVLKSYSDMVLSGEQMALKYKNMSIAASVLSATAESGLRKKYWSEKAVSYGELAIGVMTAMVPQKDVYEIEELNTRLLIALAMHYYEGGDVRIHQIAMQFKKISKSYLVRTGFCTNRILKSLHYDGIIQLPEIDPFKYT